VLSSRLLTHQGEHDTGSVRTVGYYITLSGTVTFFAEDEARIVQGMKALNHRHDLKTGERNPKTGDPYEDKWFAWTEPRYHEDDSITTVEGILDLIGVEVTYTPDHSDDWSGGWDQSLLGDKRLHIEYANKWGAHEVWFTELARLGVFVDVEGVGEEHDRWLWTSQNGTRIPDEDGIHQRSWTLYTQEGRIVYDHATPTHLKVTSAAVAWNTPLRLV